MTQLKPDLESAPAILRHMSDLDSHEMIPVQMWPENFGEGGEIMARITEKQVGSMLRNAAENTLFREDVTDDAMVITWDSVWSEKGPQSPGAIDFSRRAAVLDAMGVDRQLIFPTFGLLGHHFNYNTNAPKMFNFDPMEFNQFEVGRKIVQGHNSWASRIARTFDSDRLRAVGMLFTDELDQMMSDSEGFLADGVPAFWISGSSAPAGTSPGNLSLDPFWRLMSDADAVVTLHLGTEFGMLRDTRWGDGVPQFVPSTGSALEFPVEPYRASTMSLQADNFLTAMILGGVFERHPALRFGVIECGASWIGPLARTLDVWAEEFSRRLAPHISMRPSEYIARNVRVTPFHFEPVDEYIERYPDMVSVYSYNSDYPHMEGGKYSSLTFHRKLERLGADVEQKFFVDNGRWLLPDLDT